MVWMATDGADSGNPGPGGWGAVLETEHHDWCLTWLYGILFCERCDKIVAEASATREELSVLTYVEGDMLTSPAQTLVNTVNLVGVMGKGLALRFKQVYPEMFAEYQTACRNGAIGVGRPWLYKTSRKWIMNFPTKRHWRNRSQLADIVAGLENFARTCVDAGIYSVAFPALGCGNGELVWNEVRPVMERYLRHLPIDVFIYPPQSQREPPEYGMAEEIREWLCSEPASLPSSEVWDDLVAIARLQGDVVITEVPGFELGQSCRQLQLDASDQAVALLETDLDVLWDILRTHGFLDRPTLNQWIGLDTASYMWDLLTQLSYIDVVRTGYSNQSGSAIPTLQLRLPPRRAGTVSRFEVPAFYGG